MSATLQLTKDLIARKSVTPDDAGCQEIMIERLEAIGFDITRLPFGDVQNFWATYGTAEPLLVFAGHTDVVPPGPEQQWDSAPFEPTEREGKLYGRGAADMKGSLAAMVTACEEYLSSNKPNGSIAFLITSDEEGIAVNGTVKVVQWLQDNEISPDYCIVGEPSSSENLGDTIKIGRRGSLNADLTIHGIQGHVAYPQLADNPIHRAMQPLAHLSSEIWDEGNDSFPATSFQVSNIHGGTGAVNVIPGEVEVKLNFRFSTELNEQSIRSRCEAILQQHDVDYTIDWKLSGNPFLTSTGEFVKAVQQSVEHIVDIKPILSTSGGTSDGRFIAPIGTEVVELGPCNESIHKVNENVSIAELEMLSRIYADIMKRLL